MRRSRPSAARPISAGERAARMALIEVVQDREPLRRSAQPVFRLPALGDVGDHPHRSHHHPSRPTIGLPETRPQTSLAVPPPETQVGCRLAAARCRSGRLGAMSRDCGVEEINTGAAQHRAVLVAEHLHHPLVDVGDHPVVVGHPDSFLGRVHQLLESLLAVLERAGPILETGLPPSNAAAWPSAAPANPASSRMALASRSLNASGSRANHLEHAEGAVVVAKRDDQDAADARARGTRRARCARR